MGHIGILDQFHELIDTIGIRTFLYALLDCEAYLEPIVTFLFTFRYEEGVIRFRIIGDYHELDLDQFCDILQVPQEGRLEENKVVHKTCIHIT